VAETTPPHRRKPLSLSATFLVDTVSFWSWVVEHRRAARQGGGEKAKKMMVAAAAKEQPPTPSGAPSTLQGQEEKVRVVVD